MSRAVSLTLVDLRFQWHLLHLRSSLLAEFLVVPNLNLKRTSEQDCPILPSVDGEQPYTYHTY